LRIWDDRFRFYPDVLRIWFDVLRIWDDRSGFDGIFLWFGTIGQNFPSPTSDSQFSIMLRKSDRPRPDGPNFVSQPMHETIPDLMLWLETIGLQLSVTPIAQGGTVAGQQTLTTIESKAA
jgi:hypothetical protein